MDWMICGCDTAEVMMERWNITANLKLYHTGTFSWDIVSCVTINKRHATENEEFRSTIKVSTNTSV